MELNELLKECKQDLDYDKINLNNSIAEISKLISKWVDYRVFESRVLGKVKLDLEKLYNKKFLYYTGRASPEEYKDKPFGLKILKSEAPAFIEADEDIQFKKRQINIQNEKIYVIDETIREIKSRNFQIRDLMRWKDYIDGR